MGLMLLIVFVSAIWIYLDAKSIGVRKGMLKGFFDLGPAGWFWVTALLWIVGFPAYLAKRSQLKRLAAEARTTETRPAATTTDSLAQLEKLGELRKTGVLTEEEFVAKKKELLERVAS